MYGPKLQFGKNQKSTLGKPSLSFWQSQICLVPLKGYKTTTLSRLVLSNLGTWGLRRVLQADTTQRIPFSLASADVMKLDGVK